MPSLRINPDLRHGALRAAVGVLQTARDPDHTLTHAVPMLDALVHSPLGELSRAQLLEEPALRQLAEDRYAGPWPDAAGFRALPEGSLGRVFQSRLDRLGLHDVPPPDTQGLEGPGIYLQRRLRATHDIHHCVLGLPISVAGEAAGSAYYASALRQPGSAALLTAWVFHGLEAPAEHEAIWNGVRFGLELAVRLGSDLLACRWEEGWATPIAEWRQRLGLAELLARSPFPEELALLS